MAPDLELCACGTFAIGRCSECGAPACADHSRLVKERRLCDEHATAAIEGRDRELDEAKQRFERECAEAIDIFVRVMNEAGNPGCKGSYRSEGRRRWKSHRVTGWPLGPREFVLPDGSIYVPPYERWGGGPPSVGPRRRVEQSPERRVSGAERGAWVAGLFKEGVSRDGSGPFGPIERLSELLTGQGLNWPGGYRPPTDSPATLFKRIVG
ncbi:MAG TPA: hypothetical protein VFS48_03635 [Solirubrobacterales bacterium]|nr:hypothetical protein [Solirubrobacterales bacterium]